MATFTCGTIDCNAWLMLGFFVGMGFMWAVDWMFADIDRRKKMKFDPPE